jgi:hypothetical protein
VVVVPLLKVNGAVVAVPAGIVLVNKDPELDGKVKVPLPELVGCRVIDPLVSPERTIVLMPKAPH